MVASKTNKLRIMLNFEMIKWSDHSQSLYFYKYCQEVYFLMSTGLMHVWWRMVHGTHAWWRMVHGTHAWWRMVHGTHGDAWFTGLMVTHGSRDRRGDAWFTGLMVTHGSRDWRMVHGTVVVTHGSRDRRGDAWFTGPSWWRMVHGTHGDAWFTDGTVVVT